MKQKKEPIKNWKIWAILITLLIFSVPWYLPAGSYEPFILGIPYWAWIILGVSFIISVVLTLILKYCWNIMEDEEMREGEENNE